MLPSYIADRGNTMPASNRAFHARLWKIGGFFSGELPVFLFFRLVIYRYPPISEAAKDAEPTNAWACLLKRGEDDAHGRNLLP